MMAALVLLVALAGLDQRPDPQADFAAAQKLYASAAYEEALDRLGRIRDTGELRDQVETYKALCLLALGRARESERVLEQILTRNPQYVPDETAVSPRLTVLYRAVRARILPPAARTLYATARANYEDRKFDVAAAQLRELLGILNSEESDSLLSDLKVLAEDFLKLAEAEAARLAQPGAAPSSEAPIARTRVAPGTGPVYSMLDKGIAAPVEITRPVPIWTAPRGMQPALYQGLMEVVIDEAGRVESAVVRRSIAPSFDAELLAATASWRFQPASRNGTPVKYRRTYEIIGHSR
jgi:TonB family protein